MLMGAYNNDDNLGFSLRRTIRRATRRVRRLPKRATRGWRSRSVRRVFGSALPKFSSRIFRRRFSRRAKFLTAQVERAPIKLLPVRKAPGRKRFLKWLKQVDPSLYRNVASRMKITRRMQGRTLSGLDLEGLDLDGLGTLWDDIKGTVTDVLKTGVQVKQQRDLYKLQLARAEKGLPPLDASQVAPTFKTQIEIGPETRSQLFSEIGAGAQKYILPLAIGAGALWFTTRK